MNRQTIARKGFTLVEILVAITVIAILGGMLVAGLFPALRRAQEMATFSELKQIEQSIESFKTKYGFYPPSFIQFQNLDYDSSNPNNPRVTLMRRYLNRISPNHQESPDRINAWFQANGNSINPNFGHDIVFWLSGLFKNKQFPLTGSLNGPILATFSVPATSGDLRDIFFEFKPEQLFDVTGTSPPQPTALVATYSQLTNALSPLIYVDSASYSIEVMNAPTLDDDNWPGGPGSRRRNVGYFRRIPPANPLESTPITFLDLGTVAFENPETFQLFFSGLDNTCGDNSCVSGFNVRRVENTDSDNIANFANGRMDSFANSLID